MQILKTVATAAVFYVILDKVVPAAKQEIAMERNLRKIKKLTRNLDEKSNASA